MALRVPRPIGTLITGCSLDGKCSFFACRKDLLSVESAEELDQLRDDASPACLVARPKARSVISVEVLVEPDVILPMRIGLEFLRASVYRPAAGLIAGEDPSQSIRNFPGHL